VFPAIFTLVIWGVSLAVGWGSRAVLWVAESGNEPRSAQVAPAQQQQQTTPIITPVASAPPKVAAAKPVAKAATRPRRR
jgi:hypothetical protein